MKHKNIVQYATILLLLGVIFFIELLTSLGGIISGTLHFDNVGLMTYGSLAAYLLTCAIGLMSTKWYFLLLPFQILAFPSLVDNIIPGVYLGSVDELDASISPLFTHIDLFLILGILKGVLASNRTRVVGNTYLMLSVGILMLSSIVNLFYSKDVQDFYLIVVGLMHVRYLVEAYILFSLFDPQSFFKQIVQGLVLSVFFLFVEALVFTRVFSLDRLTSGTLGNNSFANVLSCLTVFFIFIRKSFAPGLNRLMIGVAIGIGLVTVVLTQTRMAVLAGIILFFLGVYFFSRKSFRALFFSTLALGLFATVFVLSGLFKESAGTRFDLSALASNVEFNAPWSGRDIVEMDLSIETHSLLTRLNLFKASMEMIAENPVFGIGSNRWNLYKGEYGFNEDILLDAHNGYLAIVSQFGLPALLFVYFVYFWPLRIVREGATSDNAAFKLALIPVGMAICDLSNAGIYKHQIFALLGLVLAVLVYLTKNNISNKSELK